jgi:hypothetical protein
MPHGRGRHAIEPADRYGGRNVGSRDRAVGNHADLPVLHAILHAKDSDRAKASAFQWGAVAVRGLPLIQYSFEQYRILQEQCIFNQVNLMQPIINYATF